jgi:hypothetical protein
MKYWNYLMNHKPKYIKDRTLLNVSYDFKSMILFNHDYLIKMLKMD